MNDFRESFAPLKFKSSSCFSIYVCLFLRFLCIIVVVSREKNVSGLKLICSLFDSTFKNQNMDVSRGNYALLKFQSFSYFLIQVYPFFYFYVLLQLLLGKNLIMFEINMFPLQFATYIAKNECL